MKVFCRGYSRTGSHSNVLNNFTSFECETQFDLNITYSYCLLLEEGSVFYANSFDQLSKKSNKFPLDKKIVSISGSNDPIVALAEDGDLYKLGLLEGNKPSVLSIPKLLHDEDKIVKVASCSKITVAVSREGSVFNVPVRLNFGLNGIKEVVAGREHCLILDSQGNVYSLGSGSRGQLGHGTLDDATEPRQVEALAGVKIATVAAGGWHSCALSADGDLYTWGWNGNGQLGSGADVSVMATPRPVDFDDEGQTAVKVACGVRHTVLLMEDNKLYGCGWNKYKQLTNSESENINKITLCHDFKDGSIYDLKCGPWSTAVITQ